MDMGIRIIAVVVLFFFASVPASAGDWNLVKNVKRLERVSPDYQEDKEIDAKFIDILNLTENTKKGDELYSESKRIAANPALAQSKYMDSLAYFMLVKSLGMSKSGTSETDHWLNIIKTRDKSHHLLPAYLIRLRLMPKNSPDVRRDTQVIVDWLKTQKPEFRLRSPEYAGNILLGYKPRANFAEGDPPKLFTLSYYKDTVTPLAGFMEDETYVMLLGRIKTGREDIMNEMISIYKKAGRKKEAADLYFALAMQKASFKDYEQAKTLLDNAVRLNPEHAEARKERDRIKLELTYKSLQPAEPEAPATQEESPGIPEHLKQVEGFLTPADRIITETELGGRTKAELRVMRNEVYARRGRVFGSSDLHDYFSSKPWYRQNASYSDSLLTEVDRENIRILQETENRIQ